MWKLLRTIVKSLRSTKNPNTNKLEKRTMFEKKQKKMSLLDKLPSSYESVDSKAGLVGKANRIYIGENDKMYRISPIGVVSEIETDEFVCNLTVSFLKEMLFMKKIQLFFDKDNKSFSPRLPESLIEKKEDGTTEEK